PPERHFRKSKSNPHGFLIHFAARMAGADLATRAAAFLSVRTKNIPGGSMATRRRFLKIGASAATGAYLTHKFGFPRLLSQVPGGTLPPAEIPKFVRPLFVPRAMPQSARDATTDSYTIGVRQFAWQVLPSSMPATEVWGYGSSKDVSTFSYPGFTIEAQS